VYFCTKTFVDNQTLSLSFFDTVHSDKSLGNMEQPGRIGPPNWFRLFYICVDYLREVTTTGATGIAGAIDDVHKLMLTARGRFDFSVNQKTYCDGFPLSLLRGTGALVAALAGTWTAVENIQYAANPVGDGGFWTGGAVTLAPNEGFSFKLTWPAVIDFTADCPIRVSFVGMKYGKIV
jgi:nitroreductase